MPGTPEAPLAGLVSVLLIVAHYLCGHAALVVVLRLFGDAHPWVPAAVSVFQRLLSTWTTLVSADAAVQSAVLLAISLVIHHGRRT